jgi:hypothetical protein
MSDKLVITYLKSLLKIVPTRFEEIFRSMKMTTYFHLRGVPMSFVRRGGGLQIQLKGEGRANGMWGRYPPIQGLC